MNHYKFGKSLVNKINSVWPSTWHCGTAHLTTEELRVAVLVNPLTVCCNVIHYLSSIKQLINHWKTIFVIFSKDSFFSKTRRLSKQSIRFSITLFDFTYCMFIFYGRFLETMTCLLYYRVNSLEPLILGEFYRFWFTKIFLIIINLVA